MLGDSGRRVVGAERHRAVACAAEAHGRAGNNGTRRVEACSRAGSRAFEEGIYGTAEAGQISTFDRHEQANRGTPNTEGGHALAKDISYLCGTQVHSNAHACIVEQTRAAVTSGADKFWAEYAKPLCMEDATPGSTADARAAIRNWQSILATAKASAAVTGSEHFTFGKTKGVKITLKGKKEVVAWQTSLEEAASAMEEAASKATEAESMLSRAVAQANAFCQHVAQEKGAKARGAQTRTAQGSMTEQTKQRDEKEESQGETSIAHRQDRTEKQGEPEASRAQRESTAPSRCRLLSAVALAVGMALTPATLALATLAP
ncbi:hypothetical protein, conserved in T. vivax [Trypanosoma vivax Y486]|uniref:Uncharacterized protein n=1 Tax=Trypanosoma vivax (strain Y486) TaxID=1055687 RepID=F9WRR4_TRYVY|nr:hypothetical protein, conserved in T. vivax [Trypanosoma vivax Y486]|eukprot:CCD20248.1 hypothetical protein, conserved in T. vivax [Trypanosoma vivax Y486]